MAERTPNRRSPHPVRTRTRIPTPGPELELLEAAIASGGVWQGRGEPVLFREPALPTGFPDLVAVFLTRQELLFTPERLQLRSEHLQLLHYIHGRRSVSVRDAAEALLWSERALETMVDDLELAELVHRGRLTVRCASLAEVFIARRIVAVEAKIDKWKDAVRQAVANTWFASHSYVLLPAQRWSHEVHGSATHYGIGVLLYDGRRTEVRVKAAERRLPASYGSWLLNEWTVRRAGKSLR